MLFIFSVMLMDWGYLEVTSLKFQTAFSESSFTVLSFAAVSHTFFLSLLLQNVKIYCICPIRNIRGEITFSSSKLYKYNFIHSKVIQT